MIKVIYNKVCGRCVQSEPLTSGMVGQTIQFEYSHDFDGLAVTAVFTDGKNTVDVVNPGNECVIPHEVLTTVGAMVKVGIYAVKGNELVIPTVYATIGVVLKGADPSGDVSADPTLPVWSQVQEAIGNLNDLNTEAKNNLVSAINEAAQTGGGGGGSSIALDTTLTQSGKAADAKAVGDVTIRQAELGEDGVASFKNAAGIVLFTVDFSNLTPAVYGDMVISAEAVEIAEGGSGTFAVHLATAPTVNQPVYLAVSDNTRLSVSPSSLTFTPENYATPQTVTVTAAQDDDADDDTITVTLTSRKVDAKQLLVSIVDDDKPQLVTDGLVLHFDYSGTDRSSDIITDSAGGVTASGWSTTIPGANGIIGATKPITVDTSTEAWANFVAEMKGSTEGFTIEQFASSFGKTFSFTEDNYVFDKAMVSNVMTYPGSVFNILTPAIYYKNKSNESVYASYSVDGVIRLSDGSTITPNTSTVELERLPNWNNYAHTVIRFYPDGTCKRTINGCQYATDGVISDFDSFDFDAMFSRFYILPRHDENEKRWHKTQRIYNRILTEDEIKNNETVEASKLVLSTF